MKMRKAKGNDTHELQATTFRIEISFAESFYFTAKKNRYSTADNGDGNSGGYYDYSDGDGNGDNDGEWDEE